MEKKQTIWLVEVVGMRQMLFKGLIALCLLAYQPMPNSDLGPEQLQTTTIQEQLS